VEDDAAAAPVHSQSSTVSAVSGHAAAASIHISSNIAAAASVPSHGTCAACGQNITVHSAYIQAHAPNCSNSQIMLFHIHCCDSERVYLLKNTFQCTCNVSFKRKQQHKFSIAHHPGRGSRKQVQVL